MSYTCPTRDKKAYEYMQKGFENINKNIDVAIIYFKGAINKDSMFCDAYDYLSYCFRRNKQYDSALNVINASLRINSSNYWARKTKGFIYMDKKDYNQSAIYFKEQNTKQPNEGIWLYYYTESLIKLNLLDSAQTMTLKMQYVMQQQEGWNSLEISLYLQGKIACKGMSIRLL